jgi:hypothetical protein
MAGLALPLITTGISALANIFANKPKTTTTDTTGNWNSQESQTPTFTNWQSQLLGMLTNQYLDQMKPGALDQMFNNYAGQGAANIAQGGLAATHNIQNLMASRGIRGPAAAFASAVPQVSQQAQLSSLYNSIPLLKQQYMNQMLGQAGQFAASIPHGMNQVGSGTQTQHSTQTGSGNQVAGGLFGLGQGLAGMYGSGLLSGIPSSYWGNQNYANNSFNAQNLGAF